MHRGERLLIIGIILSGVDGGIAANVLAQRFDLSDWLAYPLGLLTAFGGLVLYTVIVLMLGY